MFRLALPVRGAGAALAVAGLVFVGPTHCAATNYKALRTDIESLIDAVDEKKDDGTSIAPTFVRLAWHWCVAALAKSP